MAVAHYLRQTPGTPSPSSRLTTSRFNVIATARATPAVVSSRPTSTASRRFFRAASRAIGCTAAARATRKAFSPRRWRRSTGCGAQGETRVGLLFVVGEERGSDGARLANERRRTASSRFLIDGEPTDNRLGLATRGILRLKLRATGRAAHSSFPELGESAIDKLIDALVDAAHDRAADRIRFWAGRTTPSDSSAAASRRTSSRRRPRPR